MMAATTPLAVDAGGVTPNERGAGSLPFASLVDVIARLELATSIPLGASLDEPIDVRLLCAPLSEGVERLRAALERPERVVPLATIDAAREAWERNQPDLQAVGDRNVRILCADHETAMTKTFVNAIAAADVLKDKPRWRDAIIRSYFHGWRTMDAPDRLEALLRDVVGQSRRGTARFEALRRAAPQLFSAQAATEVAESAVQTGQLLDEILSGIGASRTGGFGRTVAGEVLVRWAKALREDGDTLAEPMILERFRLEAPVRLGDSHVPTEAFGRAVESLVTWPRTSTAESFRQQLEDMLVMHPRLGDPRLLLSRGNWDVCPDARDIVVKWLSRRDLAFFFDFVMDQTEDPHGRKDFWSRYIDQVMDSAVALCSLDTYRLRVQVTDRISHASVTGTKDVSAFLMRFAAARHLMFVEFSQPGNALYVLNLQKFERSKPQGMRSFSFDLRADLKGSAFEESFTHHPTPGWQTEVADYLRSFGIRPTLTARR
jgi:hypothetical protein